MRNEWNEPSLLLRLLLLLSLIFQETLFVLFFLLWLKGFHTFPLSEGFQLLVKGHEIYLLALPHATLVLLQVWNELLPLLSTSWTFHCSCLWHSQVYGIVGVGALVPEQRGLCCSSTCPSWPDGTPVQVPWWLTTALKDFLFGVGGRLGEVLHNSLEVMRRGLYNIPRFIESCQMGWGHCNSKIADFYKFETWGGGQSNLAILPKKIAEYGKCPM